MRGLFFTGTDTGVGKTYVTGAVAQLLRRQGRRVRVSKPVATGAMQHQGHCWSEDTLAIAEAAGETDLPAITPWLFQQPVAPPVAARMEGVRLELAELSAAVHLRATPDSILLVEGVGGLLCPLTEDATVADLVEALLLPLVIVARRELGTLNHTLLTLEAARGRGLRVGGVVVNETHPATGLAEETNLSEMRRLGLPLLALMPYGGTAPDLQSVDWWNLATRENWTKE